MTACLMGSVSAKLVPIGVVIHRLQPQRVRLRPYWAFQGTTLRNLCLCPRPPCRDGCGEMTAGTAAAVDIVRETAPLKIELLPDTSELYVSREHQ